MKRRRVNPLPIKCEHEWAYLYGVIVKVNAIRSRLGVGVLNDYDWGIVGSYCKLCGDKRRKKDEKLFRVI